MEVRGAIIFSNSHFSHKDFQIDIDLKIPLKLQCMEFQMIQRAKGQITTKIP